MKEPTKKLSSRGRQRIEHEAEVGLSGALAGAAAGALAGPPGAVAGAVIGGVVGVLAGVALERRFDDEHRRDDELDKEIGVTGGDLGASCLEHPPASRGAYSGESTGLDGSGSGTPAEGPMQSPES